jgi:5-methylcytosine-specific restriction endonuclease McrA
MSRSVPEWIGKTADSAIPPRVRARVFERAGGICHISGRKIMPGEPWDCDHIVALINGGENRESNLAPALRDRHREKTAADAREKADVARTRKKHLGIKSRTSRPLAGSKASGWRHKMSGEWVRR